jgi:tetratricopeptide (TPR) repeat protein
VLPFAQLDPAAFERLCLWLAQARGYQRVEHTGAAGSDGGRDVIAWRMRDGREELVYFQCKHARVSPKAHLLRADVEKILGGVAAGKLVKPAVLVFMTTINLSARLRDDLRKRCSQQGVEVEFLAATELDREIKQHPGILREFFDIRPEDSVARRLPRMLPPAQFRFVNRQNELTLLDELLLEARSESRIAVAVLKGMGGVGKSALGAEWVHRHKSEFDAILHADLTRWRQDGAIDMLGVVGELLGALKVELRHQPADYAGRVAVLREQIADLRILLYIDGADQAAHVLPLLPTCLGSAAVVTSQYRLEGVLAKGARLIEVSPLDQRASRQLLLAVAGRRRQSSEPAAVGELLRFCGGLPLLLSVCGARVAGTAPGAAHSLVRRLQQATHLSTALSVEGVDVGAVFDAAYESLPQDLQHAYRSLAGAPLMDITARASAVILDTTMPEGIAVCESLAAASLLDPIAHDRWRPHDLIRQHAIAKLQLDEDSASRDSCQRRVVRYYAWTLSAAERAIVADRPRLGLWEQLPPPPAPSVFKSARDGFRWWEAERRNVLACAQLAARRGWHHESALIAEATWPLAVTVKSLPEGEQTQRWGIDASVATTDFRAEARFRSQLARFLAEVGNHEEARHESSLAITAAERSGDPVMQASIIEFAGVCELQAHDPAAALTAFTEARARFEDLGVTRGMALQDYYAASALIALGSYERALDKLAQAFDPLVMAGDEISVARAYLRRGEALFALARMTEAAEAVEAALAAVATTHADFEKAEAYNLLAQLEVAAGRAVIARELERRAMRIYRRIGHPRAFGH